MLQFTFNLILRFSHFTSIEINFSRIQQDNDFASEACFTAEGVGSDEFLCLRSSKAKRLKVNGRAGMRAMVDYASAVSPIH